MVSPSLRDGKEDLKVPYPANSPVRGQAAIKNDISHLKTTKMLDKLDLDIDSPRLRIALDNLGINVGELKLL